MWVHLTGELSPDPRIIVYEYQKTRHSDHPKEYYIRTLREFWSPMVFPSTTRSPVNWNIWKTRIAGRMPDVIFRMPSKRSVRAARKRSKNRLLTKRWYGSAPFTNWKVHYGASSPKERLKERQTSIKPLVEEYFAWVKETLENKTLLPKGKAAEGLHYSINQESYLKLFLTMARFLSMIPHQSGH